MDKSFYIKTNEPIKVKSSHRESYLILNKLKKSSEVFYNTKELNNLLKLPYLLGFDFNSTMFLFSTFKKHFKAYHNKIDLNVLYQHFQHNGSVALNPYKNSKILLIDIDQKNQFIDKQKRKNNTIYIVDKIIEEFGEPFYIERNNQNYHIYIQTDTFITTKLARNIEKYFSNHFKYVIEVIDYSKTLRLPVSKDYASSYGTYYNRTPYRIKECSKDYLHNIVSLFENRSKYINKFSTTYKKLYKSDNVISVTRYSYNKKINTDLYASAKLKFNYGCGTRHTQQINIGFYAVKNKCDFNEFVSLCEYCNDGTSKDMKDSNRNKEHMLYKMWDWCQTHFNESGLTYKSVLTYNSIFNQELSLNNNDFLLLQKGLNESYDILNENKKFYSSNKKRFILDSIYLYEFIFEKRLDDISRNKECEIKEFNQGVSLGMNFLFRLQKHLQIKNPRKCLQFLRDVNLLQPILTKIGKKNSYIGSYSYIYKTFTIHYAVSTIESWYQSLKENINCLQLVDELDLKKYIHFFSDDIQKNFNFRKNSVKLDLYNYNNKIINNINSNSTISISNRFFIYNVAKFENLPEKHLKFLSLNFKTLLDLGGIPLKERLRHIQKMHQKTVNITELIQPLIT